MVWIRILGTLVAFIYGCSTAFRRKTPLFYKIAFFGIASCTLGTCYYVLALWLRPGVVEGFHVGYFGYIGMFFFLFSSYYGAMNSIADGKEKKYRPYRLAACVLPVLLIGFAVMKIWQEGILENILLIIFLVPSAATIYFAGKHLIMPDVEMGIIATMRPYNAVIVALCITQMILLFGNTEGAWAWAAEAVNAVLVAASLPLARKGVRKWFI